MARENREGEVEDVKTQERWKDTELARDRGVYTSILFFEEK